MSKTVLNTTQQLVAADKNSDKTMEDLISQGPQIPQAGQGLTGKVLKIGKSAVIVDLGAIGMGMILGREIQENPEDFRDLKIGDEVAVKVLASENDKGLIEISLLAADRESGWDKLTEAMKNGEIMEAVVLKANRGGLLVEINKAQGFMPASQLNQEHYPKVAGGDKNEILKQLQLLINKKLKVKIIDVDPGDQKLIVSEKALEQEKNKQVLASYQVGDVVDGTITNLTNFGAFFQFNADKAPTPQNIEGLIHISEMDWLPVADPNQILKTGQKIQAKIVDINNDRVSLSLKALKPDPWQGLEGGQYEAGQKISGKVSSINRYGAFVALAGNIQAIVPMSEFSQRNQNIQDIVKLGEEKEFKIISLDAKAHRLALGLL